MLSKDTLLLMKFSLLKLFFSTNARDKISSVLDKKVKSFELAIEQGKVTEPQFEQLVFDILDEIDEHMYMWRRVITGRATEFIQQGPQFMLIITAPNIKTSIADLINYQQLILPPSYQVSVKEDAGKVYFQMTHSDVHTPIAHIKEDTVIALWLFIFREICGKDFDYEELWFPKTRKYLDTGIVQLATKAKITFHEGPMTAVFNVTDYEKENYIFDGSIRDALLKTVELKKKENNEELTFTDKVMKIISSNAKPAALTTESVADELNTSISTFRRNLLDENTSFKELQGKVIDQLAFDYLLLSDTKIDAVAYLLGYTERSSFERAFRNKFGTTPANLRTYMGKLDEVGAGIGIQELIDTLPPLPESCRLLIKESESDNFDLTTAIKIIEKDAVFSGRIMGLANKAIYGRPPRDLADAIGRNLGLGLIKNLAIIYAASESLENEIIGIDILKFIHSQIMAPNIFRVYAQQLTVKSAQQESFDQILMFGLLGFCILCHKQFKQSKQVIEILGRSSGLVNLMYNMRIELNVSLLGTTGLLLSMWGLNSGVIKYINQLENKLAKNKPLSQSDDVILVALSSSLTLCLGLNFKDAIQLHAKKVSKINFNESWAQAEEVIKQS